MLNKQFKEVMICIIFSLINLGIAYLITFSLGVPNIILYKSLSASNFIISYEVIIFFILAILEAYIYEYKIKRK